MFAFVVIASVHTALPLALEPIELPYEPALVDRMWLPWGISERALLGATRVSLSSEVSTVDSYATTWTTLHAQMTLPRTRTTSTYLTMPMGLVLEDTDLPADAPHRWFGNADIGVYFGEEVWRRSVTVFRAGVVLPTATERIAQPASMRAGDVVMELPKSYGGRLSVSRLTGWNDLENWFGGDARLAVRLDAGFDYVRATEGDNTIVVPHAGLGLLFAREHTATVSLDTAVSHAYQTSIDDGGLRWSSGVTIRLADARGGSSFQPAITLAAVRTPDGWGGALAVELGAAFPSNPPIVEDEEENW